MLGFDSLVQDQLDVVEKQSGQKFVLARGGQEQGFEFQVLLLRRPTQTEGGLVIASFAPDYNPNNLLNLLPLLTGDFFRAISINDMIQLTHFIFELSREFLEEYGETIRLRSPILDSVAVRLYWVCRSKRFMVLD